MLEVTQLVIFGITISNEGASASSGALAANYTLQVELMPFAINRKSVNIVGRVNMMAQQI